MGPWEQPVTCNCCLGKQQLAWPKHMPGTSTAPWQCLLMPGLLTLAEPVRLLDLDRGPVLWLVGKIFANVCSVIFSGLFTLAATWKLVLPGQIGCMSHRKGDHLNAREHSQVLKDTWHTCLFSAPRAYSSTFTFMLWYYRIYVQLRFVRGGFPVKESQNKLIWNFASSFYIYCWSVKCWRV